MPRMKRLRGQLKYPIVIDGRNLYDPGVMSAQGFTYYSVGRAPWQRRKQQADFPSGNHEQTTRPGHGWSRVSGLPSF